MPAATIRPRSRVVGQPPTDVGPDVPADDGARREQRDRRPVEVGDDEEDQAGHDVGGEDGERLEGVDDPQLEVGAEAEDRHHHHARPGAEVAAVHAGQGGEEGGDRRHPGARLGGVAGLPAAQPARDPRLRTHQEAGEQDQPRHDALEHAGRQGEQQDRSQHGAAGAGDDDGGGDDRVLAQLAAVAEGAAQTGRGHADGVGRVGDDRRQPDGQQGREADERGDADRGGEHAAEEVRIIAGAATGGAALVVQGDGRLSKPADFKGRAIATPQLGNTQDVACRAWLKKQGYKITQIGGEVKVLPTANPDQLALFSDGKLDGVWTVEPWVSRLELEAKGKIFLEQKDTITTVLVSSVKALKERAALVKKFAEAHAELTKWINDHPDEAKKLANAALKEHTKREMPPELINHSWPRITFTADIKRESLESFVVEAKTVGFLKEASDLSRLVSPP